MDYWGFGDLFGSAKRRSGLSGGMIFLMVLVFILTITLSLVWSDFIFGWGFLRRRYPGEKCLLKPDGTHNCLDGLACTSGGICTCPVPSTP